MRRLRMLLKAGGSTENVMESGKKLFFRLVGSKRRRYLMLGRHCVNEGRKKSSRVACTV